MKRYIGLDVSSKSVSLCVEDESGEIVEERTIRSDSNSLQRALNTYAASGSVVVEASPLAEWICTVVETSGISDVSIIDARHAQALGKYGKKTDKVDARLLATLCRTKFYTPVHRKSAQSRALRSYITARKELVESATSIGSSIRGLLRAHGVRLSGKGDFEVQVNQVLSNVPLLVREALNAMLMLWKELHTTQRKMYKRLQKQAATSPVQTLLMSIPGVGAAVAATFVATIDDPNRFANEGQVSSYLGLVPKVYQSGETEYHGRITKCGDTILRWLLVEAANVLLTRCKQDFALKRWGLRLQEAKGAGKARVAVARKLACQLYRTWKSGEAFRMDFEATTN